MARGDFFAKLEGGEQLRSRLAMVRRQFVDEMRRAIPEEAQQAMVDAQKGVPVASGKLRSSAVVSSEETARGVRAAAAYEDEKAAAVHEGIHWRRKFKGTAGFKWLEKSFEAFAPKSIERLAARLRRLTGG